MSPAFISRRTVVAGAGAALAASALPAGVVEVMAAETPPVSAAEALPAVFDPRAFCNELIDAGFRITASRPVWCGIDDDDRRPTYFIYPPPDREFGEGYRAVMAKWSDAMDACPDHVEQVVDYAFRQDEPET